MTGFVPHVYPHRPRQIAVLGDSLTQGLGARGRQYPVLVAEALGVELIDLSGSARVVSLEDAGRVGNADVVVVAHGVTEAILRPTPAALRCVPPRWRRTGWLDPRPFFSSRRFRGTAQRLESAARWRVKVTLMRLLGSTQFVPDEDFARMLRQIVDVCGAHRTLLLGGFTIDDRFYPGSAAELARYAAIARDVAADTGARYVDVASTCERWDDYLADHFHPNQSGHRKIADRVLTATDQHLRHARQPRTNYADDDSGEPSTVM